MTGCQLSKFPLLARHVRRSILNKIGDVLYGKQTQNCGIGSPGRRLSHRVHMGRARSVARRSGKGKSEHRGHERNQWRCADRRRVRIRLDGRPEGGKATAEGAVGCGLQQIAMASRALSDASAQRLPRAMECRLVADSDRSWHGRADLLALLEPVVGERHRPGDRGGHPGPRSIERRQPQWTETFCLRHKCKQDGAPNLQSRGGPRPGRSRQRR